MVQNVTSTNNKGTKSYILDLIDMEDVEIYSSFLTALIIDKKKRENE